MNIIIAIMILIGSFFCLTAAIGIVRMKDIYIRMHSTTKAGTLGVGLILFAVALSFPKVSVVSRVLGIIFFIVLTSPVGAHLIGKAVLATYLKRNPKQ